MSVNLGLLVVIAIMIACGAYLLMERSLVRMLLGLLVAGNGVNLLILVLAGGMGNPPIMGRSSEARPHDADPLAQAMVLTAIVITMGVAAFILAMVYRLFVLNRDEDVDDDTEDVKVATSSLQSAPDRDRSDDPVTGADTSAGDFFDDEGNPLTEEEYIALHRERIETDLMPEDADVVDELATDVVDVIETGEAYAEPGGSGTGNSDGTSSDDSDGGRS
ncbi:putative monovalent cation/H+ antiporter subunit C [Gordonia polyisoprenivorans VH2]|uniref:Na(+)/H(+) antiporter subunit C n=2 Tax=Gordonia polyisoprenivorans TaxID=84595 RepID=A0A846WE34_9ACTN|nr:MULTISPECIES: Na(+)/H(+) antiporter subunit C [Gordonia]AFA71891.1 putative monovalent cation/H+ antiporter subunit C [Gordonia polyisoprenivorans VH2]MBE7192224.1 Na(+)/H(+) antiporter subunit C [Gordonia polyisoprenivorans]MDF3280694.1 Na(+)/H(+) antiporter subunit C [Gordonia sp. N1V]NKY00085.1 Na(+)/H(+) antiporter subunit C [Gordonia polyisoprenivorans]OPX12307.1 Na(+)/H(+) antiporter subunit C [Gordonia sp. i37]